jgi:histidinol dehydrogenase
VERELETQLATLPTRDTAQAALDQGFAVVASDLDEAVAVCDRLAPEHLQVLTADADAVARRLDHWADCSWARSRPRSSATTASGPNHTLPTGGVARFKGGLSVFDFLRIRTWLELTPGDETQAVARDAAALARLEGLEAHARAAERRLG